MTVLTARHPILDTLSDDLLASGKWRTWAAADPRLAAHASLADALQAWRRDRDEPAYLTVAALASLGSARGGNDDDAALAVAVLLQDGIVRVAHDLRDRCELDDVLGAVWEQVKRSAPTLGHRAPRFLLRRAKVWLLDPARGFSDRIQTTSLETASVETTSLETTLAAFGEGTVEESGSPATGRACGRNRAAGRRLLEILAPDEQARSELTDLLGWARRTGVLTQAEVDLVLELMAAFHQTASREDAYRLVAQRHGIATRTVRRRQDAVVARLREAAGHYLADVA